MARPRKLFVFRFSIFFSICWGAVLFFLVNNIMVILAGCFCIQRKREILKQMFSFVFSIFHKHTFGLFLFSKSLIVYYKGCLDYFLFLFFVCFTNTSLLFSAVVLVIKVNYILCHCCSCFIGLTYF